MWKPHLCNQVVIWRFQPCSTLRKRNFTFNAEYKSAVKLQAAEYDAIELRIFCLFLYSTEVYKTVWMYSM